MPTPLFIVSRSFITMCRSSCMSRSNHCIYGFVWYCFFMSSCTFSMSQKKNVTLVPQSNKAAIFAFWIQLSLQLPYSLCRSCKKIRLVVFIILHISNCSNIIANLTALGNSYLNGTGEGVIWSSIILLCEIHKMSDSSGNTKNICVWTKIMAGTMSVWCSECGCICFSLKCKLGYTSTIATNVLC